MFINAKEIQQQMIRITRRIGKRRLCHGLKDLLDGKEVDFVALQAVEAPCIENVPKEPIPASQVAAETPREAAGSAAHNAPAPGVGGLTQSAPAGSEAEGAEAPPQKKLRVEPPLQQEDFKKDTGIVKKVLLSAMLSTQDPYKLSKNVNSFNGNADAIEAAIRLAFRFMVSAGLAVWSPAEGKGVSIRSPPPENAEDVYKELQERLSLSAKVLRKLQESMGVKTEANEFNFEEFKRVSALLGDSLQTA